MNKKLLDYLDFEKIDILLEGFNKATGFVTAILDLDGNILSKSGWRTICTDFHRIHPETSAKCLESDTCLAGQMVKGQKYNYYSCVNGLVDVAVPIIIKNEHVANLFSGQFFFEKPDLDFFKKQAEKYKFDTEKYLEALKNIPILSEEKVKTTMNFLLYMTNLLSEMTQQRIEQDELNNILIKSDERWQFAIEENGDGLFDWNIETNEIFFSKQWKAMLGFENHEIENKFEEWDKRVHPDDKEKAYLNVNAYFEGKKEIYTNEHRLLCKNGTYKWISAKGKIIARNANNEPIRLIGTHRVIDERKQAEYLLQESEEKYKALFENAPLSYQSLDINGKFIDINPSWLRTLGYERDEVIGMYYADFLHPEWKPHFEKNFPAFKKRGYVKDVHFKIRHKKGHYIDISFEGCIGYLPDGSFKQTYCVFQDITESKKIEEELQLSKERFEKSFLLSPYMVSLSTMEGLVIEVNDKVFDTLGYTRDEFMGQNTTELPLWVHLNERANFVHHLKQGGTLLEMDVKFRKKEGDINDFLISACIIEVNEKKILLSIIHNITKRKNAEDSVKVTTANLESLLDNRIDSIWSLDCNYNYIIFNKPYANIIYKEHGVQLKKGMNALEIQNDIEIQKFWKSKFEPVFKGENVDFEFTHLMDKKDHYFQVFLNPIITDGIVTGASALSMDITERKLAEKELIEIHEKLEDLVDKRTEELGVKNLELERMNKLFVGRELRMIELKEKIKELEKS